jgi:uncharacterized protein YkwD
MRQAFKARKLRAVVVAGAIAVLASACGPSVSGAPSCNAPSSPPPGVIGDIYRDVNIDRRAAGLPALSWNRQLYCLATEWSGYMARTGSLVHRDLNTVIRSPEYSGYRTLGENILRGPGSMSGAAMEDAWMASAGHRANILSRSFTSIGIGIARAADGRVYATQNFGG